MNELGTFTAVLEGVKNVGQGQYVLTVNYSNAVTNQVLTKEYTATADTYSSADQFIAFVQSEVDKMNGANAALYQVIALVGTTLVGGDNVGNS